MPERRRVRKGSFSSHFDDLVKHFTEEKQESRPSSLEECRRKKRPISYSRINQRLFEGALH